MRNCLVHFLQTSSQGLIVSPLHQSLRLTRKVLKLRCILSTFLTLITQVFQSLKPAAIKSSPMLLTSLVFATNLLLDQSKLIQLSQVCNSFSVILRYPLGVSPNHLFLFRGKSSIGCGMTAFLVQAFVAQTKYNG